MSELEHQLRAGGEVVASGTFKIDAQRALKKLRENRLADPHHWVLEILRAAALSKAKKVEVRIDTDDVEVSFDGRAFSPAVIRELLVQSLDAGDGPDAERVRLLSLGVAGALALHPKWVRVESNGVKLEVGADDEVSVSASSFGRTRVMVRKSLGWSVVGALFKKSPELLAITDRARWFGCPLVVNKKGVDRPLGLAEDDARVTLRDESAGIAVHVAQVPSLSHHHELVLVSQGLIVTRRELQAPGLPCKVIAQCEGLRRNASGSDVVDADPVTQKVFEKVKALVLAATAQVVEEARKGRVDDVTRAELGELLLREKSSAELVAILDGAPILPGPGGEWYSVGDFRNELKEKRPLRYSLQPAPTGSYPAPTVLLASLEGDWRLPLLPAAPTVDVKKQVEKQARAAVNKAHWKKQPVEEAVVVAPSIVGRAPIAAPGLKGEVALVSAGDGAFVRFLCQGRFLQQGEVQSLAPLRLRATVNWEKDVPEKLWAEMPTRKLFSLAARAIEDGAEQALASALLRFPSDRGVLAHAEDMFERCARLGRGHSSVPPWLADAKVFPCHDGSRVSLNALRADAKWKFTPFMTDAGLLSGERLLVLSEEQRGVLAAFGQQKLVDVTERLNKEREIRRRIAGPKQKAVLFGMANVVPLENAKFQGEVGVGHRRDSQLSLALHKGGIPIETVMLPALYGQASAVVDSEEFTVDDDWESVKRDTVFEHALRAVRASEVRLVRALVERPEQRWADLSPGPAAVLLAYLLKEVDFAADAVATPITRAVMEAKLFTSSKGQVSLVELKSAVDAEGALYVRWPTESPHADTLFVVLADDELAAAFSKLLGRQPQKPDEEVMRRRALKKFLAQPVKSPELAPSPRPKVSVVHEAARGEVGLGVQDGPGAHVQLLVQGRPWREEYVSALLPLAACLNLPGVDPLGVVVQGDTLEVIRAVLLDASKRLVHLALRSSEDPHARRLLLWALATNFDEADRASALSLRELPIFPCTDGQLRSARQLQASPPVLAVCERLEGASSSGKAVVLATDPMVKTALGRFGKWEDVTRNFARELDARAARAKLKPRERILCAGPAVFRRSFVRDGIEGEVAVSLDHPRRFDLLTERKPLCTLEGELPAPFAAAVNHDALNHQGDGTSVQRDRAFRAVVDAVLAEAEVLAAEAAAAWQAAGADKQDAWRVPMLQLAVWAQKRPGVAARLAKLPLLETTAGEPLALEKLLPGKRGQVAARYSTARIAPLDRERWVWCPRPDERELLAPLHLKLVDYSEELQHAEQVRSRPKQASLEVTTFRDWVEPIAGKTAEGEVALRTHLEPILAIEVLKDRAHLELWSSHHPVGAVAKVNCDALTPTAQWKRAVRNRAFRTMVEEVEDALERLLVRRLEQGPRDDDWRRLAMAAVEWGRSPEGALGKLLPSLAMFLDTAGQPVTLGRVLDQHARFRRVAVARAGLIATEGLVLADGEATRKVLAKLKVEHEDIGPLLEKKAKVSESIHARRLARLGVDGEMLVRLRVDEQGVRGELSIPVSLNPEPRLMLAREAIAVIKVKTKSGLPVCGVLDCPWLEVNEDWTHAKLDARLSAIFVAKEEELYLALPRAAESSAEYLRLAVRDRALEFLAHKGLTSAAGIARMTGAAEALTRTPVFRTTGGEWVSLVALADEVARGQKVAVMPKRFLSPDVGDALVLQCESLEAWWVDALKGVLGPASVERISDLAAWKRERAESDPQTGTPLHRGLVKLRRQLKLLRAGALGKLTPDDLEDVRLSSAKLKRRVEYDAARKLLLLDAADPHVTRALEEMPARPERLYVLLVACYGEVNRALERITDAHEAHLLAAMAVHLASNPEHLSPAPASADKEEA